MIIDKPNTPNSAVFMRNHYRNCCTLGLLILFATFSLNLNAQGPGMAAFGQAEGLRKSGRCKEAILKYEEAIQAEPSNYRYYFAKGKCHLDIKEMEMAKIALSQTVEYKQDYSPAYSLLANIYKAEKNFNEAIRYYEDAVRYEKSDSKKVQYQLLLVNLLLAQDRPYDASRYLDDARYLAPDNPRILYYSAEIAAAEKDWTTAKNYYEQALATDDLKSATSAEKAKYYYGLGLALTNLGDNTGAKAAWANANFGPYKKLIDRQLQQTSHTYYYKIAISYFLNNELEEADAFLDKSIELQNDFARAYVLRGKIERKRGNMERAIRLYEQAIDMEKDPAVKAQLYSALANMQLSNNDSYGALSSVDNAISGSSGSASLLFLKARAQYGAGRYRDAVATLDQLMAAGVDAKTKAKYSFMKGMAARRAGDNEDAKNAFQAALFGPYKPAASNELSRLKGAN